AHTLRRNTPDTHTLTHNLATTHTHGHTPTWPTTTTHTDLPTYPFQHHPYWLENRGSQQGERLRGVMAPEPTGEAAVPATPATSLSQRLAAEESVEEQHRILRELVLTHVSSILGHVTPDTIDGSRAFKELGFDSLAAVDFRNHLSSSVGLTLPTTLTFDHPTP
ncbi:acyl carrier protein, partial [Streptomyces sp. MCAF7]